MVILLLPHYRRWHPSVVPCPACPTQRNAPPCARCLERHLLRLRAEFEMQKFLHDLRPEVRAAHGKGIEGVNRLFLEFWDRNEMLAMLCRWREFWWPQ